MKTKYISSYVSVALYTLLIAILLVQFAGCSKKSDPAPATPTPTAQEEVTKKMTAVTTWKMQSVTVDGADKTSVYKGLTISFTSTAFTTANGGAVWPASGTWTFTSADATSIKRDDGLPVNVEVTDTTLKLTLTWTKTTLGGGKAYSVSGVNVFTMVK
jgi:hypothetical protein